MKENLSTGTELKLSYLAKQHIVSTKFFKLVSQFLKINEENHDALKINLKKENDMIIWIFHT